ncbi:uncharacterized protein CC84DRAFT_1246247 [Paraphaeosphaeria sporulosa]|uniref:Uncharacterized protein n=1 Tax=Paraphaeosphaeria sporulosa TaxID=1460663 RepID=A0A177CAB9_9PLEO|nr:uncharacterized protein CC84DRAFT_1246247 [Paraphaeosphaeria sporulosa]OAG04316.1 hypothetical protein CC84DRAFT_1246247 [Paraphaeosphaeria sporulosa]
MAPRKRKSVPASDSSEADRTCEYCGHKYNNKSAYTAHCISSGCAVLNRGASMWKCFRCNMRSAHRKTIVEKCWETCDECAEAGLEKCDAVKQVVACTSCRRSGMACTKLPKGQVADGGPVEIAPAGSGQDDESENTQPDASYAPNASQDISRQDPPQLPAVEVSAVRDQDEDTYMEGQEDEVIGSNQEKTIHEDGNEKEGSQNESGRSISVQNDVPNRKDEEQRDVMADRPKSTEPDREARSPTSPSHTLRSHKTNTDGAQDQHPQIHIASPNPPQSPFSTMTVVIAQPQTQTPAQIDTLPRDVSTALSPVDRAFLSGTSPEQNHHGEDIQTQPSPAKEHPARGTTPPIPLIAPVEVSKPSPSPGATFPVVRDPSPLPAV